MDNKPKKTKVLFVITKSNFGGAQKYVFDLAVGLPKDQFDVAVALGGTGILIKKLQDQKIRVIPIFSLSRDVNPGSDLTAFFELLKIFRDESPDVVHLNSAKAGGVGALAARLAGVPKIIFTAHGWAFNEERPCWQRVLITFFSWITVVLSHETIAVSDAVKNDTKGWPLVSEKISVIKNGIREPEFLAREDARMHIFAMANIQVPVSAFVVGTIAELHNNKGLSYAIEAFAKLVPENPNLYYFVLGGGEEKERLEALVEIHNLQGRVFLLGFVDDASRYLKAFDLFLLSSITEGLALVLLEAGLANLPVVASKVGGIPEVIENERTGLLVPTRNPEALAPAIKKLSTSTELRTQLGTALHMKVSRDFSLERIISETTALYIKLQGTH
ncbi:MAG: glycosyltransferase family 4 protein [Candidatus Yonathbacteria bacterium]|nr:glycosyltransferase family 4 protein [Candidatus Yonathbacteria bacterium]